MEVVKFSYFGALVTMIEVLNCLSNLFFELMVNKAANRSKTTK